MKWGATLQTKIAMLPTPTVNEVEHKDMVITKTGRRATKDGKDSHSIGLTDTIGTNRGLKLQPAFVEWMMGFPHGWTDLNCQNPDIEWNDLKHSATP
jgi:hypothetical protein